MRPPRTRTCPSCGHEHKVISKVETSKGDLQEVRRSKPRVTTADKQRWFSELIGYARRYGKTHKWVLAKYRSKFEVWPRGLQEFGAEPSHEVLGWIRHSNIAYAKRRAAEEGRVAA
jgi:hypothetical protein